jgi:anti-anti-sigma regulatory factor
MSGRGDFTIIVTTSPDRTRAVVVLGGDLDIDAGPELGDALRRLAVAAADSVEVDVAAVRYVGSVLPNFLAQIHHAVPATSVITVSRPTLWAQFILRVTDMAEIAKIDEGLPVQWHISGRPTW